MTKLYALLFVAIVGVSLSMAFILHRKSQVKLRENEDLSRRQEQQLLELSVAQRALSSRLAAAASLTNSQEHELAKLRHQSELLQKQTNELHAQIKGHQQSRAASPAPKPQPRPPEYYEQLHRTAGAKPRDAKNLSEAFAMYAWEHQGRFPSNVDQVASYLRKEDLRLSGTNQFEIVYHGTLDELKGIPGGAVALFRDQQTWIAPSGKPARVYGLANGSSQIVESEDDFKAWEAEHIVASPGGKQ